MNPYDNSNIKIQQQQQQQYQNPYDTEDLLGDSEVNEDNTETNKKFQDNNPDIQQQDDEIRDTVVKEIEYDHEKTDAETKAELKSQRTLDTNTNENVWIAALSIATKNIIAGVVNFCVAFVVMAVVVLYLLGVIISETIKWIISILTLQPFAFVDPSFRTAVNQFIVFTVYFITFVAVTDLFIPGGMFTVIDIAYTIIFGIIFNLIFGILGNVLLALLSIFGMIWDPFLDVIVAILYFISCNLLGCCGMDANPVCAFSTLWRAMLTFWDIIAPFVNAMLKIFLALVGEEDPVAYLRRLANVLLFAIPNWITCFLNLWPTSINLIEFVSCFIQNVSQFLSLIPVIGPSFKCIVDQPNLGAKIACFFAEYFKMITVVMSKIVIMILCVVFTLGRAACNLL